MYCGDVYRTTVNVNGKTVFSSRFSPCCCPMYSYPMMSCFGYGFGGFGYGGFWPGCSFGTGFGAGIGAGLGIAAGAALVPAMPAIVKGIGQGACWVGTKVIAPAAKGAWQGISWVGKKIGKGVSSIFHKKNKTEKTSKSE